MSTGMQPVNPSPSTQNRIPPSQEPPPPDQVVPPAANQNLIAANPTSQTPRPVDQIRALMRSSNPLTDAVTTDDLQQVKRTFEGLSAADANTTFSQLSNQEIRNITGEMQAPGVGPLGGLSADDRRDVIANMSQKLDAKNFERFSAAYGNAEEIASVLASPGSKATTDAKIGYISAFDEKASSRPRSSGPLGVSGETYGNEEAKAIGQVLASMRDDQAGLQRALGTGGVLDKVELENVLQTSVGGSRWGGTFGSKSYDTTLYSAISNAAASSNRPDVKANFFQASSGVLRNLQRAEFPGLRTPIQASWAATTVGASMDSILRTDPRGITAALRASDVSGSVLTPWTRQMLTDGKGDELRLTLNALRNGPNAPNGARGNPNTYLQNPKAARDLGYMVGGTINGINALKADAKDRADLISKILGVGVKQVPGNVLAKPLVDMSVVGTERLVRTTLSDVELGRMDSGPALLNLMFTGVDENLREPAFNTMSTVVVVQ